jgi:hypothetical protein
MPTRKTKVPPLSDLLRTGPAIEYTRKSRRSLYRLAEQGLVNRYYIGSTLYWSKSELDALVTAVQPQDLLDKGRRATAARIGGAA